MEYKPVELKIFLKKERSWPRDEGFKRRSKAVVTARETSRHCTPWTFPPPAKMDYVTSDTDTVHEHGHKPRLAGTAREVQGTHWHLTLHCVKT